MRFGTMNVVMALAMAAGGVKASAQTYTLVDLGSLGGQSSAFTLTAGERTGGSATVASAHFVGAVFDGAITPVPPPAGAREAIVPAFDASGRAIVLSYSLGESAVASYVLDGGSLVPLGAFAARAANATGDIAGTANLLNVYGTTVPRATLWHAGTLTTLPTLGGLTSMGLGLDAAGRVLGSSTTTGELAGKPCLWNAGAAIDLGTLGGSGGQALAGFGTSVVGASQVATGPWHATRWTIDAGGHALSRADLGLRPGAPSSFAHAINAAGVIVGTSGFHAVAWVPGSGGVTTLVDLNDVIRSSPSANAGWTLENAWAIDDDGVIVGNGSHLGYPRAFLLRPCGCSVTCAADFDGSGGTPDATDIDAFFTAWLAGAACADVDCSGGTPDATDIDEFFSAWLAGGC